MGIRWPLVVLSLLCVSSSARAQQTMVLEGDVPAEAARYFTLPFTLPAGVREIEFRHDDRSEANILDWGLRDPERFRGWGGGNTEAAVLNELAASRSYLPGPLPEGRWSVLIGLAKVVERPARYRIELLFRDTPTLAPQTERTMYTPTAPLSREARWYAGDFHVHSRESGDASPTIDEVATFARSRGLDFVEYSEHNTNAQVSYLAQAQARHRSILLVPGFEFTTYAGHANAIGGTQFVDFTAGTQPGARIDNALDAIRTQQAVFSINHPALDLGETCIGCSWQLNVSPDRIGAIEIQTGAYSVTGALFYRQATNIWESFLQQGAHITPVGGSDDHRAGQGMGSLDSPIGSPTTMVYATELSVSAIVAAVAAGRTVVKLQGPDDPMVELTADGAMIGDTLRRPTATLRAQVTRGRGASLRFYRNGVRSQAVDVNTDSFSTTLAIEAPVGTQEDRWRCELVVNGQPRVVTGHLWIAPVSGSPSIDAGSQRDVVDEAPLTRSGGCGCRTTNVPKPGTSVLFLLLALRQSIFRKKTRGRSDFQSV